MLKRYLIHELQSVYSVLNACNQAVITSSLQGQLLRVSVYRHACICFTKNFASFSSKTRLFASVALNMVSILGNGPKLALSLSQGKMLRGKWPTSMELLVPLAARAVLTHQVISDGEAQFENWFRWRKQRKLVVVQH